MTISKADRYTEISRYLLEESRQQLDRGDLIQASEKAWGATAHAYLHNNFYEHAMTPTQVRGAINDAAALIEELHTLRQQTPSPFDPETRDQQTPPPKAHPPPAPHRRRRKRPPPGKASPTPRGGLTRTEHGQVWKENNGHENTRRRC